MERLATGIEGFDRLVAGGLPVGSTVVLQGPSGTEKLAFALAFLARGLRDGASGLAVVAAESPDAVLAQLRDLGVDIDLVAKENRLRIVDWYSWGVEAVEEIEERGLVVRSPLDLTQAGAAVSRAIAGLAGGGSKRAVLEMLSPAVNVYELTQVYAFAQSCKRKFDRFGFTGLVLLEREMHEAAVLSTLHQPFDGVIEIERGRSGDRIVRKIGVLHLKDTTPDPSFVPLDLTDRGLSVGTSAPLAPARVESRPPRAPQKPPAPVRESAEAHAARMHRVRAVRETASERLRADPRDADALFALAAAEATLGNVRTAAEELEKLMALDPDYPGLWGLATKLYASLGEEEKWRAARDRASGNAAEEPEQAPNLVPCPICDTPLADGTAVCPSCGSTLVTDTALFDELEQLMESTLRELTESPESAPPPPEPEPSPVPAPPLPLRPRPRTVAPIPRPPSDAGRKGLTNGLVLERKSQNGPGRTNGLRGRTNGLRGRTNGLTNGLGRTNGLTNGLGRTNGLTNGLRGRTNGLTNGLGRTNGLGLTNGHPSSGAMGRFERRFYRSAALRYAVIGSLILILMIPAAFLLWTGSGPAPPIQIDGQFSDWAGVPKVAAVVPPTLPNPDTEILSVAVKDSGDGLAFYLRVQGSVLSGSPAPQTVTNAYYAFIDADRSTATGYRVQGIGADRMVRIYTYAGQVVATGLFEFDPSRGARDWNGWTSIASVDAAGAGSQMEFQVPWYELGTSAGPVEVAFAARSWDGQSDAANVVVTDATPYVTVVQDTAAPPVVSGSSSDLAVFTLHAVGGPVTVSSLTVSLVGTFTSSSVTAVDLVDGSGNLLATQAATGTVDFTFTPFILADNTTRSLAVRPHAAAADGRTIGAFLPDLQSVSVGPAGVVFVAPIASPASLAYVGAAPAGPRVDGAFGEWASVNTSALGNVRPVWDRDVDLSEYAFKQANGSSYFTAAVAGTALNGTMIPAMNPTYVPPSGNASSNGTVGPPPPALNGTDTLRFFLDSDGNASTGFQVGGLGADYLVEITGKDGLILSSELLRFSGANPLDWSWAPVGPAPAAKDLSHIEAALPGVAVANGSRGFFLITGWNGAQDDSGGPSSANVQDPVLLGLTGVAKYSGGTSSWVSLPTLPPYTNGKNNCPVSCGWAALTKDSSNNTFAIDTAGQLVELVSKGTSWTSLLSPPSVLPSTNFNAIATDSQGSLYGIAGGGGTTSSQVDVYNFTLGSSPVKWNLVTSSGGTSMLTGVVYVSGKGGSATLYGSSNNTNTVMRSTNGAKSWSGLGSAIPGANGGSVRNRHLAITSSSAIYVLMTNGTVAQSSNTGASWTFIQKGAGSATGNVWIGIAYDGSANLWTLANTTWGAVVWKYALSGGSWTNMTPSSPLPNVVGITAAIPEFSDLVVPVATSSTLPLLFRRLRCRAHSRGRGRAGDRVPRGRDVPRH